MTDNKIPDSAVPRMTDPRFEQPLFDLLDEGLSKAEAAVAKAAIARESRKWVGSHDWYTLVPAIVTAALQAVADYRNKEQET